MRRVLSRRSFRLPRLSLSARSSYSSWMGDGGARSETGRPKLGKASTTAKQRRENERAAKLATVQEMIDSGSLVIRPMTRGERARWAARRRARAAEHSAA
jgi:hypothetical protein